MDRFLIESAHDPEECKRVLHRTCLELRVAIAGMQALLEAPDPVSIVRAYRANGFPYGEPSAINIARWYRDRLSMSVPLLIPSSDTGSQAA